MAANYAADLIRVEAQLEAANVQVDALLACIQPTYTVDGETFKTTEHLKSMTDLVSKLEKRRSILESILSGGGFTPTQVFA